MLNFCFFLITYYYNIIIFNKQNTTLIKLKFTIGNNLLFAFHTFLGH
jgi:hypothetical protein